MIFPFYIASGKSSTPVMYLILVHTQFKEDIGQFERPQGEKENGQRYRRHNVQSRLRNWGYLVRRNENSRCKGLMHRRRK